MIDVLELLSNPQVFGPIVVALIVATAGFFGYGRQKEADRRYDLVKLKQKEYERYLNAFQEASRWKGVNKDKHAEAESTYHLAQNYMLLHASKKVVKAVNAAHRYYVESEVVDWRTYKKLYAEMIVAMRKDGYNQKKLSVQEVKDNIPWTIGTEVEDKALERRQQ